MSDKRATQGVPLPSLWQFCVFVAAACSVWVLWSEYRRAGEIPDSGHNDPGEALRSVLELSRQGQPALGELTGLLQSEDSSTRRNALLALMQMGPQAEQAVSDIRPLFTDEDSSVRACALLAYSRVCDQRDEVAGVAAAFLADAEKQIRESAVRILEAAGEASIPALIRMAPSDNSEARQNVIRLLFIADRKRDPGEVNAVLRSLLDDPDAVTRLQAIHAVVGRGAVELGEIRGWLREDDPKVVDEGLRALQSMSPEEVNTVLPELKALLEDMSGKRPLPFDALSRIGQARQLIPILQKRASAPECRNRFYIAKALVEIGADPTDVVPILISLLSSPKEEYNNCWQAGQLLARIDPLEARRQVSRIVANLEPRVDKPIDHTDAADLNALSGLGAQASEALPLLIKLLSHPNGAVPGLAMSGLARLGPDAAPAVPALMALIDQRPYAAIQALGSVGSAAKVAVPKLLEVLDDSSIGEKSAKALGAIGDSSPEVLAALRRTLKRTHVLNGNSYHLPQLRLAALQSLLLLDGDSVTTRADVLPLLTNGDPSLRIQSILALGHLTGDRREVFPQLIEMLADEDPGVRTAAALALGQIGPSAETAIPALRVALCDSRNRVNNSTRGTPGPWTGVLFLPPGMEFSKLSVAQATRWAIAAIEATD